MIRRGLIGALCIALALGVAVWGEVYLQSSAQSLLSALEVPPDAPAEALFAAAEDAVSVWQKIAPVVGALVKHMDADGLAVQFAALSRWAAAKDETFTAYYLRLCCAGARQLADAARLKWENVLYINKIFVKSIYF